MPEKHKFSMLLVFGSALQKGRIPNDLDLAVVTDLPVGSIDWKCFRVFCRESEQIFPRSFKLPLSIFLLSSSEWREVRGIMVRSYISLLD